MNAALSRSVAAFTVCLAALVGCGQSSDSWTSVERVPPADSISIGDLSEPPTPLDATDESGDDQGSALATPAECLVDNFDAISLGELPDEAIDTLELIANDGPFPFDKDGSVFQNRERLLPKHDSGYYREYTVIDPSQDDRGPRRVVTGDCGERFYTDDHYDSFQQIEP